MMACYSEGHYSCRGQTRTRQRDRGSGDIDPLSFHGPNPFPPSLSPSGRSGGEGARMAGEGDSAWFMVPMPGRRTVETFHESACSAVSNLQVRATFQSPDGMAVWKARSTRSLERLRYKLAPVH